jgi:hypothetical protein
LSDTTYKQTQEIAYLEEIVKEHGLSETQLITDLQQVQVEHSNLGLNYLKLKQEHESKIRLKDKIIKDLKHPNDH